MHLLSLLLFSCIRRMVVSLTLWTDIKSQSVQFSCSVVSDSLWPHELQHTSLPCPSLSPRVCLKSCPLSQWCHPTISSSITHFSSCPQSFPASGSFPVSRLFISGGQTTGASASASVLLMNFSAVSLDTIVICGCESGTVKKAEGWRIDAFELWCWRRVLDCKEIQPVHPKGNQPWILLEGLMLKLKLQ